MRKKQQLNLLIYLLILSICFSLLRFFITYHPISSFDIAVSKFVQQYQSQFLDKLMLGISLLGELPYSLLMVVIIAFIFFWCKYKREAYFTFSILLSGLLILALKSIFNRPRPTANYVRLVEHNRFESFPSGHVLSYFLFFGFMLVLMKELKTIPANIRKFITFISIFYIVTIPYSRIYLGAHWFTDVLGGMIMGLICLIILCYFYLQKPSTGK